MLAKHTFEYIECSTTIWHSERKDDVLSRCLPKYYEVYDKWNDRGIRMFYKSTSCKWIKSWNK